MEQYANTAITQLDGTINSSVTSIVVDDGSVFPSIGDFRIVIEDEIMLCTARSSDTLTVVRGQEGTAAAGHADDEPVSSALTKQSLLNLTRDGYRFGAYSTIGSAGREGRVFIPENSSGSLWYDNGSAWQMFVNNMGPMTPPVLSAFGTSLNFGSRGSVIETYGYVSFFDAGVSTGADFVMAKLKSAPSTPYTITLVARSNVPASSNAVYGIMLRDSSSGRIKSWFQKDNDFTSYLGNWSSSTTYNNTVFTASGSQRNGLTMLRLSNNGTILEAFLSQNFVQWQKIGQENVSGNFLANIDQIGFGIDIVSMPFSHASTSEVDFLHWSN